MATTATATAPLLTPRKKNDDVREPVDKSLSSDPGKVQLMSYDQLPEWRKDNSYLLTGYRETSLSYFRSITSILYLHNEFVNIWSHLLGALAYTAFGAYLYTTVMPRVASANPMDIFAFGSFFMGCLVCFGMSATYHTLSNHSAIVARIGNKLDYLGIVGMIVGSYMGPLYYYYYCQTTVMYTKMVTIGVFGLGCAVVSWVDRFRTPAWRPYRVVMFVALGFSGAMPLLIVLLTEPWAGLHERYGVFWIAFQGVLYVFGAVLYALRWPERQYPGTFDIFGSSHQIFHVFVLLAAASHLRSMLIAFDYHHDVLGGPICD